MPSMVARTASLDPVDPDAAEFVRFCYRRRRVGWPELYDEMCAVAARGLYRGMGADELAGIGIGLSLFDMPGLAALAARITAEEQAKRRPVAVTIIAEPTAVPVVADEPVSVDEPVVPADVQVAETVAAQVAETADVAGRAAELVHPVVPVREERTVERDFDVPIRLATAPAGA